MLDPGEYILTIRKTNTPEKSRNIKLANGQPTVEIDLTPIQPIPINVSETKAPPVPPPKKPPTPQPTSPSTSPSASPQRAIGWTLVGMGGAGVFTAAGFGAWAIISNAKVNEQCTRTGSQTKCSPTGYGALIDVKTCTSIGIATLVASGALITVGVLNLSWSRTPKNTRFQETKIHIGPAFVMAEGRF